MPLFQITFGENVATQNVFVPTADPQAAEKKARETLERPIYCRLHDDIPPESRRGNVGEMGYYHPRPLPSVTKITPMREVYMGGGYCLVEAGEVA